MTEWDEFAGDLGGDYDVQCARCGKTLSTKEAIIEEGDEWECPECWERCNEQERIDALGRFHYPPRYKYTCYGCGGPLSAQNAGAGKDCGFCQKRASRGGER